MSDDIVDRIVDAMPLLSMPLSQRETLYTAGGPFDFHGRGDGKLYANDKEFHIKGINWYGTEGKQLMLEGLNMRPLGKILDFLTEHKFNAMRLLFNMQDWRDDTAIPQDHFSAYLNPEFVGLRYRAMLLQVTRAAAQKGIMVMLACHRLRRFYSDGIHAEWPSGWDGWWFDNKAGLPVQRVSELWTNIARYYCREWNVFAADIFNEPSQARWNTGRGNDWGAAAGRYGNAVLDGCPRLLIFVQGAGRQNGDGVTDTCWGGSFTDARAVMSPSPVPQLRNQTKLVLSPHAYGPSLYKMEQTKQWMPRHFKQPLSRYPQALPEKWDQIWGFTPDLGLRPPLVLSETGGDMTCCDFYQLRQPGADAAWQVELVEYLHRKSAGLFYFCLNPWSDDTGGLLKKDFRTPEVAKLKMLSAASSTRVVWTGMPPARPPAPPPQASPPPPSPPRPLRPPPQSSPPWLPSPGAPSPHPSEPPPLYPPVMPLRPLLEGASVEGHQAAATAWYFPPLVTATLLAVAAAGLLAGLITARNRPSRRAPRPRGAGKPAERTRKAVRATDRAAELVTQEAADAGRMPGRKKRGKKRGAVPDEATLVDEATSEKSIAANDYLHQAISTNFHPLLQAAVAGVRTVTPAADGVRRDRCGGRGYTAVGADDDDDVDES